MSDRAERIERIRELLEDRRHPERRVGIFSATNLTRVAIRLGAMAAAAAIVQRLFGVGGLSVPIAGVAVAAADEVVARLWRRIGRRVQQAWTVIGLVAAGLFVVAMLVTASSPRATAAAGGWWNRWLESRRSDLDQRVRSRRTLVDSTAAVDPHWRVLVDSGALRLGTFTEARAWCAALGPEWGLPPGLGQWPQLDRYPDLGILLYVWSRWRNGIQIGDGRRPGAAVSSSGRDSEVHAVLCLKGGE
jgi:hypothetical protein